MKGVKIIGILGPSGTGKTAITNHILENDTRFQRVRTTTTRTQRDGEASDAYNFVDVATFLALQTNLEFLESSIYAGEHYGTPKSAINEIIDAGKIAIVPIDINGIKAYKKAFGDEMLAVFIYREKQSVLEAIVERTIPPHEKAKRILSLDEEYGNIKFCDVCIVNNDTIETAAQKLKNLVL